MAGSSSRFGLCAHLLLLILIALVPAFALALYGNLDARRQATGEVREQVLRLARQTSIEQEKSVAVARQILYTVARLPELRRGDTSACSPFAAALLEQQPSFTNFGVIAPDGTVTCSGIALPGPVNLADRLYFQQARDTRAFAVGDYQLGRVTGKATLGFGYPILGQADQVEAVAFAAMDLAWLRQLAIEAQLPAGSSLAVVDRGGTILARYPDPDRWVGQSLAHTPLIQAIEARGEGVVRSAGIDGVERLFAFTPLGRHDEGLSAYVAVGVPVAFAYAAADDALRTNVVVLGVVSVLALGLALVSGNLLIRRPIHALLGTTARLAAGDLTARTSEESGIGELGHLAGAFNHMAETLEQREVVRQRLERQLSHQAFYDALTELPNRVLLLDRLRHALVAARHPGRGIAVVFIDLDRFKLVNETLGHTGGDALLKTVAGRLAASVRGGDTVARWGSDEFVALIHDVTDASVAVHVAERMLTELARPVAVAGREVFVAASIGIALCAHSEAQTSAEELVRQADIAVRRAKADGKARYELFDASMMASLLERLELEADLRRAIEREELRLVYQPILSLETGRIVACEALVRWEHPDRGPIAPAEFIPIAEETGLIRPLGHWVLEQACRQATTWRQQDPTAGPLVMSVNLSVRQFRNPDLVRDIAGVLERTGCPARYLNLEITESAVMDDVEATIAKLLELKALGVQLAIDDFGTGYSSLNYLKRLPVDTLKIDRSFVSGLGRDSQDAAIVRSIIGLARSLHLSVTGEGIETDGQLAELRALGCDLGQGYYFARPLSAEAVGARLGADREQRPAKLPLAG